MTTLIVCVVILVIGIVIANAVDWGLGAFIVIADLVLGFGMAACMGGGGQRVEYVAKPQVTITQSPTTVLIEREDRHDVLTDTANYKAATTAQGAWYVYDLSAYGFDAGPVQVTLIDPKKK